MTTLILSLLLAVLATVFVSVLLVRHRRRPIPVEMDPEERSFQEEMRSQAAMDAVMIEYLVRSVKVEVEDPERLAAVYGEEFADADIRQKLKMITHIASKSLSTPIAAFTVVFRDREEYLAAVGVDENLVRPLSASYCQFVVGTKRPFAVEDSEAHDLVCINESTLEYGLRSYLGVPFINRNGMILGALCVADFAPRKWHASDVKLLTELCSLAQTSDTRREL